MCALRPSNTAAPFANVTPTFLASMLLLVDRARCNRFAVAIELGRAEGAVPALAAILMRKQDGENSRLAAYHLARLYQARKEIPRALFYARQAEELARDSQRPEWIAMSHNQLGMLLLADSRFEPALERLETALAHDPDLLILDEPFNGLDPVGRHEKDGGRHEGDPQ